MVKLLKITSLVVVIVAVATIATVGVYTFRGETRADELLSRPDIIEQYREKVTAETSGPPKESPLVAQAKMFSFRIDPPPAPEPVAKERDDSGRPNITPDLGDIRPKTVQAVKFSLVATCKYEAHPEKSLALLNFPGEGQKWVRQGEEVGRAVIEEIRDGSVIYVTDQVRQEVMMPTPSTQMPSTLLAGGAEAQMKQATEMIQQMIGGNVRDLSFDEAEDEDEDEDEVGVVPQPRTTQKTQTSPDGLPTTGERSRYANFRRKEPASNPGKKPAPSPVDVTPEENVKMIDDSISQVRELINKSKDAESPEEQQGAAMLTAVLQMLEETKQEAQKEVPEQQESKKEGE